MTKQDLAAQFGNGVRYTRFTITYKDFAALTGSGVKSIQLQDQDNPSNPFYIAGNKGLSGKILGVSVKTSVAFSGGALSALTFTLGVLGALTRFTSAYDCFAAVSDTNLQETAMFKLGQDSATLLQATFTPTSDTLQNITAGSMNLDICWLDQSTTGTLPA